MALALGVVVLRRLMRFGFWLTLPCSRSIGFGPVWPLALGVRGLGFGLLHRLMRFGLYETCLVRGLLARPCAGRQSLSLLLQRK
jgi:hypothetical protein